ncbi:uncharacterized protein LOC126788633 [Argentina anserina]|uniref:uncharacterized protein LOC126788633 n=1 Tax=Argentina anserina TaxID=57926 RepID=UPI00217636D9|nr:uncharacterized protein LOC126788633 [Potentilla anserina]
MDKSWIDLPDWVSPLYYNAIDQFLTFTYVNRDPGSKIYCPCRKCQNRYFHVRSVVREHFRQSGFLKKYKKWYKHGELDDYVDPLESNLRPVQEALGTPNVGAHDQINEENSTNPSLGQNVPTKSFLKLVEDANLPLYPGCKRHTALSYTVRLLQAKELHGWTDESFQTFLKISEESMPEGAKLPKSYYEAQKLTEHHGFTQKTVDACPNSCMLNRNDISLSESRICKGSPWKDNGGNSNAVVALGKRKAAEQATNSGERREELVYPEDLIQKIADSVLKNIQAPSSIQKIADSVSKRIDDQFNMLQAQLDHLENKRRATYQNEQVSDGTSGNHIKRESIGEDVNSA